MYASSDGPDERTHPCRLTLAFVAQSLLLLRILRVLCLPLVFVLNMKKLFVRSGLSASPCCCCCCCCVVVVDRVRVFVLVSNVDLVIFTDFSHPLYRHWCMFKGGPRFFGKGVHMYNGVCLWGGDGWVRVRFADLSIFS